MWRPKTEKDGQAPELHSAGGGSLVQTITRFWLTIFFIGLVLYITVLVIGRMAGFRDLVRQRLEVLTGMSLTIERTALSPALNLRMTGIRGETTNHVNALVIGEAHVEWKLTGLLRRWAWPFRSLDVRDAELKFTPDGQGGWTPLPDLAAALWPWMTPGYDRREAGITEWMRLHDARISIARGSIIWQAAATSEVPAAMIEGLDFSSSVVKPLDEPVGWFRLKIRRAQTGSEEWLRDLELESLRLKDQDVVMRISTAAESIQAN